MGHEETRGRARQAEAAGVPVPFEEIARELQDVGPPFAEGRHAEVDAAQAVEEVLTEELAFHEPGESTVGGGHDANVDAAGCAAAHGLDGEILDDPQQLGLGREREV